MDNYFNSINRSIILTALCFGSVYLFSVSLNELNKIMLYDNKNKFPVSLFILNSSIMVISGIFITMLLIK